MYSESRKRTIGYVSDGRIQLHEFAVNGAVAPRSAHEYRSLDDKLKWQTAKLQLSHAVWQRILSGLYNTCLDTPALRVKNWCLESIYQATNTKLRVYARHWQGRVGLGQQRGKMPICDNDSVASDYVRRHM